MSSFWKQNLFLETILWILFLIWRFWKEHIWLISFLPLKLHKHYNRKLLLKIFQSKQFLLGNQRGIVWMLKRNFFQRLLLRSIKLSLRLIIWSRYRLMYRPSSSNSCSCLLRKRSHWWGLGRSLWYVNFNAVRFVY